MAMEEHLRVMVDMDGLTGLGSRRALDDTADTEWRRACRTDEPMSMLMIDIDNFKDFNDQYGHLCGDDALATVGKCIGESIRRPGDYAGRYGGEEFAVLLPNTDLAGATKLAETIRSAVQSLQIPNAKSARRTLTISVGVASTDTRTARFSSLRAFVRACDEALYDAKASGRNCVAIAGIGENRVPTS